jgi:hypothetical protein
MNLQCYAAADCMLSAANGGYQCAVYTFCTVFGLVRAVADAAVIRR